MAGKKPGATSICQLVDGRETKVLSLRCARIECSGRCSGFHQDVAVITYSEEVKMLRLTIELIPHGNEKLKKELVSMDITNVAQIGGDASPFVYRYDGFFVPTGTQDKTNLDGTVIYGGLNKNVFSLIKKVIDDILK